MGKHAMDRIMSNEKLTTKDAWKTPANPVPGDEDALAKAERKAVKVVSLSINEDDDLGGDPYNHTGSHAIPDFGQDDM